MADNILFKQGKLASLPEALNSGQILFAINDNSTTGSIYLDYKDSDEVVRRAKLNADATKLTTPINLTIGNETKDLNTDLGNISWTHEEIGADVSLTFTPNSASGPTITSLINGVSDSFTFPSAGLTVSGVVNTGTQSFNGNKTFNGITTFSNIIKMGSHSFSSTNTSYTPTNHKIVFNYPRTTSSTSYGYSTASLYLSSSSAFTLGLGAYYNIPSTNSNTQNSSSITTYDWCNANFIFSKGYVGASAYKTGTMRLYNSSNRRYYSKMYNTHYALALGSSSSPWSSLYLSNGITIGNYKIWSNTAENNYNAPTSYLVGAPSIVLYGGNSADYNASSMKYSKSVLGISQTNFYVNIAEMQYNTSTNPYNTTLNNANYKFTPTNFYVAVDKKVDLGSSSYYWNRAYINTIYGDLYGNANTATALKTSINLTIGNTSKEFNGSNNVSWSFAEMGSDISKFDWTPGTTAGPTLNLTLNGTAVTTTIPSASETESGIVTTDSQIFLGEKRFINKVHIGDMNESYELGASDSAGIYMVSKPLSSNANRFGEFYIGLDYTETSQGAILFFRDHTSLTGMSSLKIGLDSTGFYPLVSGKTLGTTDNTWETTYSNKYVGSHAEISDTTRTNRLVITNTSQAIKHLEFSCPSYNYIWAPSGGSIAFSPDGRDLNSQVDGATFVIGTDNTILSPSHASLGSVEKGFSKVYTNTINTDNIESFSSSSSRMSIKSNYSLALLSSPQNSIIFSIGHDLSKDEVGRFDVDGKNFVVKNGIQANSIYTKTLFAVDTSQEAQIGVKYNSNTSSLYFSGKPSTKERGLYDSSAGSVIDINENDFIRFHGTANKADILATSRKFTISSTAGSTGTDFNGEADVSLIIPSDVSGFKTLSGGTGIFNIVGHNTTYISSGNGTSLIFCRGGANTEYEVGRFNTNGDLVVKNSLYVQGNVSAVNVPSGTNSRGFRVFYNNGSKTHNIFFYVNTNSEGFNRGIYDSWTQQTICLMNNESITFRGTTINASSNMHVNGKKVYHEGTIVYSPGPPDSPVPGMIWLKPLA